MTFLGLTRLQHFMEKQLIVAQSWVFACLSNSRHRHHGIEQAFDDRTLSVARVGAHIGVNVRIELAHRHHLVVVGISFTF